jgi:hypothetical protein
MSAKRIIKSNFLWFPYRTPEYIKLLAAIDSALNKGYTLIEVKRFLAMEKARRLYELLCRESLIIPKKTGRPPALPCKLPKVFVEALRENDIGFYQWCNSMRPPFDPSRAARALDSGDFDSYPEAHQAFYRDFRFVYNCWYKTVVVLDDEPVEEVQGEIAVLISGDEVLNRVTAVSKTDPTIQCEATTAEKAMELFYSMHRTARTTQRLLALPDRRLGDLARQLQTVS